LTVTVGFVGRPGTLLLNATKRVMSKAKIRSSSQHVTAVARSRYAGFEQAYRDIAAKVELPGRDDPKSDILRLVYNWLCDHRNGRWLMIVDNADDDRIFSSLGVDPKSSVQAADSGGEARALSGFLPQSRNGWILATSRDLIAAVNLVGKRVSVTWVEPMVEEDALALLKTSPGRRDL
jgi:hypothetical protein